MKIKQYELSRFTDIGTIVLYDSKLFGDNSYSSGFSDKYLYSSEFDSDYIDFAKYGFSFDLPKTDYWSRLDSNLFNFQETTRIFGDSYDKIASDIVPQLSSTANDTKEWEKHYFGKLDNKVSGTTSFLAKLGPGIQKVEVYNSRLTTNNSLGYGFIDFDVLNEEDRVKDNEGEYIVPLFSIIFGPLEDTKIIDHTYQNIIDNFELYRDRYQNLTESMYDSFKGELISKHDYIQSVREEIMSSKILFICNSIDGKIRTVDFFSDAYLDSHNKHPHFNENALRNDEPVRENIFEDYNGFVIDKRSKSLLSIRELSRSEAQWFWGKYDSLREGYYSKSGRTKGLPIDFDGKKYVSVTGEDVFGEIPFVSPYWISTSDLSNNIYENYYVTKQGKGNITPGGLVYKRKNKPLFVKAIPEKGYKLDGLETDENGMIEFDTSGKPRGYKFSVVFKEIEYTLSIQLICKKDFVGGSFYGKETSYTLDTIADKLNFYYIPDGSKEEIKYSPEDKIKLTDLGKLKFRFDITGSRYLSPKNLVFISEEKEIPKMGEYYILDVSETPQQSLTNGENPELCLIGEIENRQYKVIIRPFMNVQVSTPKQITLDYGMPFKTEFALPKQDLLEDYVKVYEIDNGNRRELSGKYIRKNGNNVIFEIPATYEDLGNGLKKRISGGIEYDYEIFIEP